MQSMWGYGAAHGGYVKLRYVMDRICCSWFPVLQRLFWQMSLRLDQNRLLTNAGTGGSAVIACLSFSPVRLTRSVSPEGLYVIHQE